MLTVPITAAITGVLALFGIKPTPYLVGGIAVSVKIVIVAVGLLFGAKLMRRRALKKAAAPKDAA